MRTEPFPLNKFTDTAVNKAYETAVGAISKATTADVIERVKDAADQQRDAALSRGPLLSAACTYLKFAQSGLTVRDNDPEMLYHYAANAFRDIGLLQRAAECYFNAALVGYQRFASEGTGNPSFARRSAGRAKAMFSDLGDDDQSGDAHVLQQKIQLAELRAKKRHLFASVYWLWDLVSRFGTSPTRWFASTLIAIAAFAILYPMLIAGGHIVAADGIQRTGWAILTSSLQFSIGNLFQFGTLGTLTPVSSLGQISAMAHGIAAFVLLGSGATFLTRK